MTLAGEGRAVRESLTAKAESIRLKDLAELETEAQARSETMVLPVALMFAGFLLSSSATRRSPRCRRHERPTAVRDPDHS